MGSGESDVAEGDGGGGGAKEVATACSICLEVVMTGGGRSTVKLQCAHEFHLDCIGSAFNSKGMMQCPNCRNVEKGHWLYGNGYCFLPSFNMDEWTHDDELYDLNFLEMPYRVRWCPVSRVGRVTSSFENGESFPSVPFQNLVGHHVITELPSISVFAHPCPHLSGFHQVQPTSAPTFHASSDGITDTSSYYHQWSQVSDSTEAAPLSLPMSDARYPGSWYRYQSAYSHPRDIATASIQAPVSHVAPRSTRLEDGGPHRAGSLFFSVIGRHGSQTAPGLPHLTTSNRAPSQTPELHRQANISADPWRSGNSTDLPFPGRSHWPPSNQFGLYMYPLPVSFNSSVGDMMNTGAQFRRSGVQFMPFTSTSHTTGSMESGNWTHFRRRNSSSERQIAQARTENPPYAPNRARPYI
ncbi:hypothetical protein KFK09_012454 [Dendrobium nobile]|uniref:RING-type domain-containing protein n=1 Tax=Dendrobium nobile TaxID=94219 RepID=A0A8T3BFI2_DENNO|nr:hypothetical protein KFK09_012454 [Dendrobium nobile]